MGQLQDARCLPQSHAGAENRDILLLRKPKCPLFRSVGYAVSALALRAVTVRTGGKIQKLRPDVLTSFMPAPSNPAEYSLTCRMSIKATFPPGFSTRTISRIARRRPSTR